jgi:hypothetical protein
MNVVALASMHWHGFVGDGSGSHPSATARVLRTYRCHRERIDGHLFGVAAELEMEPLRRQRLPHEARCATVASVSDRAAMLYASNLQPIWAGDLRLHYLICFRNQSFGLDVTAVRKRELKRDAGDAGFHGCHIQTMAAR